MNGFRGEFEHLDLVVCCAVCRSLSDMLWWYKVFVDRSDT